MEDITPDLLLRAYAIGVFPMAEGRDDAELFWLDPVQRGILPLDGFHVPKRLRRTVRSDHFEIRVDTEFRAVMEGCAESAPGREDTWINDTILDLYTTLFKNGYAHSIETWYEGELVGGLYGVKLGGAFFGESMFSRMTDASKVALVHLVARLNCGGFALLDTQFVTAHLARFGALKITRDEYHRRLSAALSMQPDFYRLPSPCTGAMALQFITQTS